MNAVRPIQLSTRGILDRIIEGRARLSTAQWEDLLLRSVGLEPSALSARAKDISLLRMIRFVERNYNMVELGPRGSGNPADARMLRHAGLPALPGGRKQPSLPWARLPAFMVALDKVQGFGALALRLAILTALRSGEVRAARWSWLSFDGVPTLTVPGEVMKGKKSADVMAHRVPLSDAALEALASTYGYATGKAVTVAELPRLAALAGDRLMFPSSTMRTPISDMTLSAVLRRMNADRPEGAPAPWRDADGREAVPHGFRATFSTWVDDTRPEEREAAERALAHEVANKVSAAYRRSDLFDRRSNLMREWGNFISPIPPTGPTRQQSVAVRHGAKVGGGA